MSRAVNPLQTTAATAGGKPRRAGGRPFRKGQSGNPAGRPRGSKNRATWAAQLLLEGEAEALARKAVGLALAGDAAALRLCLDRVVAPRRDRIVKFTLPPITGAEDLMLAMAAVIKAAADGELSPAEALDFARVADTLLRVIDARNDEQRLKWLAESAAHPVSRPAQTLREFMDAHFADDPAR